VGAFINGSVFVNQHKRVVVFGDKIIPFHENMMGFSITTINNKIYIDGYEFKNGKWSKTFAALWHKYIG
jgi:hypothetical protein